ncbi:tyrosine-type recombinase/integrase [Falsiroseomonas selenitidurans]|uniref:Tyrosine-type recombinase/integrase n=1 Tax=Falsiroseomonas selenitidurans TaxID=2716335 RepID=A0ABX1E9K6_9PROT|nr:tyrosine-type recombinase/integrase [Falsiroseomonas selenitidurans]NKC33465.1 tyrosine-type recombinase/integrase [Falsiroseomonas selenitidurans]
MSKREPTRGARSTISNPWPHLERTRGAGGQTYLYYRRAGRRTPLPGPEGSGTFIRAYEAARAATESQAPRTTGRHTLDDAITLYLASADFLAHAANTRTDYRRVLDPFRAQFGTLALPAIDEAWIAALREKYAAAPVAWNSLRSRMISVVRLYRTLQPGVLGANHWETSRRLKVPKPAVKAHRPWPAAVLVAVLRAATPEFRCLLVGYLLTAQRGGDVTRLESRQWNQANATLNLGQQKTGEPLLIHVPEALAAAFNAMADRHPKRLFVTPRGEAWTTSNAQETLRRLLGILGLDRYTLHGLRATGPVALKMLGFENRAIRSLTGHRTDANLEVYLDGVDHYPLARQAQEALAETFAPVLTQALSGANDRRFSGVTGRAARKSRAEPCQQAANSQQGGPDEGGNS